MQVLIPSSSGLELKRHEPVTFDAKYGSLNPFFVRAGAQTICQTRYYSDCHAVLIPSSSGLELKPTTQGKHHGQQNVLIPSSSGLELKPQRTIIHVTSGARLNPFFVRAGAQTCVAAAARVRCDGVLIPSSSGLELKPVSLASKPIGATGLNPFFVRAGAQTRGGGVPSRGGRPS